MSESTGRSRFRRLRWPISKAIFAARSSRLTSGRLLLSRRRWDPSSAMSPLPLTTSPSSRSAPNPRPDPRASATTCMNRGQIYSIPSGPPVDSGRRRAPQWPKSDRTRISGASERAAAIYGARLSIRRSFHPERDSPDQLDCLILAQDHGARTCRSARTCCRTSDALPVFRTKWATFPRVAPTRSLRRRSGPVPCSARRGC
jgi:hypothetical protein